MNYLETLSEVMAKKKNEGYTYDFSVEEKKLTCKELDRDYTPNEFTIVESFRFEGESNPDDMSVLYTVETDDGKKGLLVDGYGINSSLSQEMIYKQNIKHNEHK